MGVAMQLMHVPHENSSTANTRVEGRMFSLQTVSSSLKSLKGLHHCCLILETVVVASEWLCDHLKF